MRALSCALLLSWMYLLIAKQPRLRSVVQICRHGARSPIIIKNEGRWEEGSGGLTPQGERMHYLIGSELRNNLIDETGFLDLEFNIQQIYVRSTPVNRTIMSAHSQLLGLYPPGSGPQLNQAQVDKAVPPLKVHNLQKIQEDLGFNALKHKTSPIPIHVTKGIPDLILGQGCPAVMGMLEKEWSSEAYLKGLDKFVEMGVEDTIKRVFNLNNFSLKSREAGLLADNILATDYQYLGEQPLNVTDQEIDNLKLYENYQFYNGGFGQQDFVQFSQTGFFMDIIQRFSETIDLDKEIAKLEETCKTTQDVQKCKEAADKERDRLKFTFYSAHDTNIAGVTKFMDILERGESPPYASTFFFKLLSKSEELTGEPQDYLVYVEFNKNIVLTFESFSDFEAFVSDRKYQGDLMEVCFNGFPSTPDQNKWTIVILVVVGLVVLIGVGLGIYCFCKRRGSDSHHEYPLNEESDRQPQKRESGDHIELGEQYGNPQL